jgi:hypothetical protein
MLFRRFEKYRKLELHPDVVFIVPVVRCDQQIDRFEAALDAIAESPEMVNIAIEVAYAGDQIQVLRFDLP